MSIVPSFVLKNFLIAKWTKVTQSSSPASTTLKVCNKNKRNCRLHIFCLPFAKRNSVWNIAKGWKKNLIFWRKDRKVNKSYSRVKWTIQIAAGKPSTYRGHIIRLSETFTKRPLIFGCREEIVLSGFKFLAIDNFSDSIFSTNIFHVAVIFLKMLYQYYIGLSSPISSYVKWTSQNTFPAAAWT